MYLKGDNQKENKSRAVANSAVQEKHDKQALQFVDNRSEAIAQKKPQELVNNTQILNLEKSKEISFPSNRQESRTVTNSVGQKESNVRQSLGFVDNRPQAIAQRMVGAVIQQRATIKDRKLGGKFGGGSNKDVNNTLAVCHRHIIFDNSHELPTVGNKDNIGFTKNSLFSEDWQNKGYVETNGVVMNDEDLAVRAVQRIRPGEYGIILNNCQDYTKKVLNMYQRLPELENEEEMEWRKKKAQQEIMRRSDWDDKRDRKPTSPAIDYSPINFMSMMYGF